MRFKNSKNQEKEKPARNQEIIVDKVDQELFIDILNINDELMNQPLLFRKYARLEAECNKVVRTLEVELERVKAKAHLDLLKSGAKLKVADAEATVLLDENVKVVQDKLIEAREVQEGMKGALLAFRQRHDALKDLSANLRKEYGD